MIEVGEWKGDGKKIVGKRNRNRVEKWFIANPGMTVADCARALGLTWQTVKKHVIAINNENLEHE